MHSEAENIKVSQADLRWLANAWERLVGKVDYPTRAFAASALFELIEAFCRGKGLRMGNATQQKKRLWRVTGVIASVMSEVIEREGAQTWYPALRKMGFDTFMGAEIIALQIGAARRERQVG